MSYAPSQQQPCEGGVVNENGECQVPDTGLPPTTTEPFAVPPGCTLVSPSELECAPEFSVPPGCTLVTPTELECVGSTTDVPVSSVAAVEGAPPAPSDEASTTVALVGVASQQSAGGSLPATGGEAGIAGLAVGFLLLGAAAVRVARR